MRFLPGSAAEYKPDFAGGGPKTQWADMGDDASEREAPIWRGDHGNDNAEHVGHHTGCSARREAKLTQISIKRSLEC